MPSSINVKVELCDVLTTPMCSQLIIEFVKYIVYQRHQIPYPYKQLASVVTKKQSIDRQCLEKSQQSVAGIPTWKNLQIENEYRKHLEEELAANCGTIEEVVLILGPTPMSPREVYRLQFPALHSGHAPSQHPHQRNLLQLLRSIIASEQLHSVISQPLAPTNLFLLLRKKTGTIVTNGFTLKDRYYLPLSGKHTIIQFLPPQNLTPQCTCAGFAVFQDSPEASSDSIVKSQFVDEDTTAKTLCEDPDALWFVARNVLKGFKDLKIDGVSVTTIWLQSS